MSHYRCEIIMPPTDDVAGAVESILARFSENGDGGEDGYLRHAFWDWYVIGGRYSGQKLVDQIDPAKLDEFYKWMTDEKITVHGIQFGKQDIHPAEQIPKVDAKWREMFPATAAKIPVCPLFRHAGPELAGDVLPLSESSHATCCTLIIAGPDYDDKTKDWTGDLTASFLLQKSIWNGVTHQDTAWDGRLVSAVELYEKKLQVCAEKYQERHRLSNSWLVVTVDYHS